MRTESIPGPSPKKVGFRIGWLRALVVFWSTVYFILLAYIYINVRERWDYLGFWYNGTDVGRLILCYAIAIFPQFFVSIQIRRFSTFIHWVIYFFIYIPAVLIPVLQGLTQDVFPLAVSIMWS